MRSIRAPSRLAAAAVTAALSLPVFASGGPARTSREAAARTELDDPTYYLQLGVGFAPVCGPQVCSENQPGAVPCRLDGVETYQTVLVSVIVDCHRDEGFLGVFYGIIESSGGSQAIHLGAFTCPGFLSAPWVPPGSCGASSTAGCQPCCTAAMYHSYLILDEVPVTWSIVPHYDVGDLLVLDCDWVERSLLDTPGSCTGTASINTGGAAACQCAGPTGVEAESWGSLKAIYR
jgi:hypothetical protein